MERPKFTRVQRISKSGEPGIRYRIEERIDDNHEIVLVAHPIVAMRVPTEEELEKVKKLRETEAQEAERKWPTKKQVSDLSLLPIQQMVDSQSVMDMVPDPNGLKSQTPELPMRDTTTEKQTLLNGSQEMEWQ